MPKLGSGYEVAVNMDDVGLERRMSRKMGSVRRGGYERERRVKESRRKEKKRDPRHLRGVAEAGTDQMGGQAGQSHEL